jgi:hypothetical protein
MMSLSSGSISHKRPSTECPTGVIKELSTTPYTDTIVLLNQSLAHIVEGGENKG